MARKNRGTDSTKFVSASLPGAYFPPILSDRQRQVVLDPKNNNVSITSLHLDNIVDKEGENNDEEGENNDEEGEDSDDRDPLVKIMGKVRKMIAAANNTTRGQYDMAQALITKITQDYQIY